MKKYLTRVHAGPVLPQKLVRYYRLKLRSFIQATTEKLSAIDRPIPKPKSPLGFSGIRRMRQDRAVGRTWCDDAG
jgi:hypothetical protein